MAIGSLRERWRAATRFFRRLWRPFLTAEEKSRIAAAIAEAERRTTGEIHVHVAPRAEGAPSALARAAFRELGLDDTRDRNGVLILIFHLDHRFAIWGDEGIHAKGGRPLWERASEALLADFRLRRYPEGIEACVRAVGAELAKHFPKADGPGENRLPDEVTES